MKSRVATATAAGAIILTAHSDLALVLVAGVVVLVVLIASGIVLLLIHKVVDPAVNSPKASTRRAALKVLRILESMLGILLGRRRG